MKNVRTFNVVMCFALVLFTMESAAETRLLLNIEKLVSYDVGAADIGAPTEIAAVVHPFQITAAGHFLYQDARGKFFTGQVKDAAKAIEVPCPVKPGERLSYWALSD